MNPTEIIIHEMKRDSVFKVINLFGKSICDACKSSHAHSHFDKWNILQLEIFRAMLDRTHRNCYNESSDPKKIVKKPCKSRMDATGIYDVIKAFDSSGVAFLPGLPVRPLVRYHQFPPNCHAKP